MSLRLHDSQTRQVRDFEPVTPGCVGIYVCGATPQSGPHLGHVRAQVAFDVLRRWLSASGYEVTYVRNVTDIDDKILVKSDEAGRPWWAHAYFYEQEFTRAYDALNILRPTYEPRATGHATEMVELIQRLIDAGHAYVAADGSGDVYFDVRSWPSYGELTHQRIDEMEPAADADPSARKKDPRDFALWKGAKPGEPGTAAWPTPWGRGRPGWHIECSAMATRYLGAEFDIHGGGLDLRFPHHENEQAQSRAAGDGFARFWLHNAWVVAAGEKMSKSLGNTLSLDVLLKDYRPVVVRYLLSAPHYRSNIEISEDSLAEARAAFERIEGFAHRAAERLGDAGAGAGEVTEVPAEFRAAMDDDLGTPAALAAVHDWVTRGNRALAEGDATAVAQALGAVRAMTQVLGIDPLDAHWDGGGVASHGPQGRLREALDQLVRAELDARAAARKERDFAAADAIRDRLTAAGVQVEDTADGARWSLVAPEESS
ncbi:cysteine--tRNA ligase [Spongisporangium articulatum]|uniref:Cysteine--tRNA ligase n=1 Tax=Spongisporangium articulatum TaxID=3362603 RepID=A0ABW8AJT9_9ACTN